MHTLVRKNNYLFFECTVHTPKINIYLCARIFFSVPFFQEIDLFCTYKMRNGPIESLKKCKAWTTDWFLFSNVTGIFFQRESDFWDFMDLGILDEIPNSFTNFIAPEFSR